MKEVYFIELMGLPGSYDPSVYDHFEDKDQEGKWFQKRYSYIEGFNIKTCNVCLGETPPDVGTADGFVLAGTYHSVHDHTEWQKKMLTWLPQVHKSNTPLLGICGSHQLMAYALGADVEKRSTGPYAGTFDVNLTADGRESSLFNNINDIAPFHFANSEQVTCIPEGTTLLAGSAEAEVAALYYGNHSYSTQFHPEASAESLGTVWVHSHPDWQSNYHDNDAGDQLIENFFNIVLHS